MLVSVEVSKKILSSSAINSHNIRVSGEQVKVDWHCPSYAFEGLKDQKSPSKHTLHELKTINHTLGLEVAASATTYCHQYRACLRLGIEAFWHFMMLLGFADGSFRI